MNEVLRSKDAVLAVGYVRCAGDGVEAKAAAEAQQAQIQAFAGEHGIQIVDWHFDMGCSGNDLERAGLQAVLAAAQSPDCGFEAVVVHALKRLARRWADAHTIEATLSESGIRAMSVTEPEHGSSVKQFIRGLNEAIHEFQSDAQSKNTIRGLRIAAEKGYCVFAQAPYGYRKVEVNDDIRRRSRLEIDPETAEVVRAMYDRAVGGFLPPAIAAELNGGEVQCPSGGAWTGPQVRRILSNPANAGVVVVGKKTDHPVEVRNAHPKIVSWDVFEGVNHLLERDASGLEAALR